MKVNKTISLSQAAATAAKLLQSKGVNISMLCEQAILKAAKTKTK